MKKRTFKHELSFSHFQVTNSNLLKQIHACILGICSAEHLQALPKIARNQFIYNI